MAVCSDLWQAETEPEKPIWIYVDDSNIWIEAKKLAGTRKRLKTVEDPRIRIDMGRLTDVVAKSRPVAQGFLYGSEPPPVDSVWRKIRQKGWKVDPHRRSRMTGKEKRVDTQLVADVTAKAIKTDDEEKSTIVLITGDADAIPAIEMALNEGWQVEVYMWQKAVSRELHILASVKTNKLNLFFLDDFLEQVTFSNLKFSFKDREHLLPYIKESGIVLTLEPDAFEGTHVPDNWWLKQIENIAQFPFRYYFIEGADTNDICLYFSGDKKHKFSSAEFLASLRKEAVSIDFVINAQTFLDYEQNKKKISQLAMATYGRFQFQEVCDYDFDSAPIYSSSQHKDHFELVRYHYRQGNQQYSEPCSYGFHCKYGGNCYYEHTPEEKKFFKRNMGKGNPFIKLKLCTYHPKCLKTAEECRYAHGEEDAWCLICSKKAGHFTDKCDQKKVT